MTAGRCDLPSNVGSIVTLTLFPLFFCSSPLIFKRTICSTIEIRILRKMVDPTFHLEILHQHDGTQFRIASGHQIFDALAAMTLFIEIIGWAAALLILAAYLMVSTGRLGAQSAAFQWMNVAGAAGFILNSGWHGALPSAALNIAWAGIGIFTLWRIGRPVTPIEPR